MKQYQQYKKKYSKVTASKISSLFLFHEITDLIIDEKGMQFNIEKQDILDLFGIIRQKIPKESLVQLNLQKMDFLAH